jgi:hypothetical protein
MRNQRLSLVLPPTEMDILVRFLWASAGPIPASATDGKRRRMGPARLDRIPPRADPTGQGGGPGVLEKPGEY